MKHVARFERLDGIQPSRLTKKLIDNSPTIAGDPDPVSEPLSFITGRAEIIAPGAAVKASNARKIEPHKACLTALAPKAAPGFDHVVQGEDLPEIQAAVAVAVQVHEEVGSDPAVALLEELHVLRVADSPISVGVQCEVEVPC
jgi:hypothetical protein